MKKFAALVAVLALVAFAAPAFAANPFMDVPMNHWAYDAVSQLASRGVVSGYPDGAFKGEWKATRYEMASVVARALAYVDMNKASKQDLELLKKLVVEFKDELDALGVKVDELDARVADLEKGVGKWYFSGYLRMMQTFADDDDTWVVNRFRWNIRKVIDDKVTMNVRLQGGGGADLAVELAYLTVKFPWDITATIGRFWHDWEGAFYAGDWWYFAMNDAYITDIRPTMAWKFDKSFGMGNFSLYVAHDDNKDMGSVPTHWFWDDLYWQPGPGGTDGLVYDELGISAGLVSDRYIYGARLNFNFNEMFSLALNYMKYDYQDGASVWLNYRRSVKPVWTSPGTGWIVTDSGRTFLTSLAADNSTLWADLVVNFKPGITFKGQYFMQDLDDAWVWSNFHGDFGDDSPNAWKAVLEIDQDVLGFTSLWLEYAQLDAGFVFPNGANPYGWMSGASFTNSFAQVVTDTTLWTVLAMQRWNEKWGTYVRYLDVDSDFTDYNNWTVAVTHWYTPSLAFELGYDKLGGDFDDDFIWLRTTVFF